jgi:hypothetical protein
MPRKHESAVEAAIRQAQEAGRFDNLPGRGEPIPGAGEPDDDLWWVKGWVKREGLETEAMLPPWLRLRKEVETLPERVRALSSERSVRTLVEELNREIRRELVLPTGPKAPPPPLDVDGVVATWAAERAERRRAAAARLAEQPVPVPAPRRRRWPRRRA